MIFSAFKRVKKALIDVCPVASGKNLVVLINWFWQLSLTAVNAILSEKIVLSSSWQTFKPKFFEKVMIDEVTVSQKPVNFTKLNWFKTLAAVNVIFFKKFFWSAYDRCVLRRFEQKTS